MKSISRILLVFSLLALSACAETQLLSHLVKTGQKSSSPPPRQEGYYKVGKPYNIQGTWYTPQESYSFTETGIASWYGAKFHGKQTANGEIYDMYQLTAAHRTLQMPSIVRVTNLENGRSIVVRINDRGPFSRGRVIDMSKRGAELLGFKNQGTARVRIDLLAEESRRVADAARRGRIADDAVLASQKTPETDILVAEGKPLKPVQVAEVQRFPVTSTNLYVQVGAFTKKENALHLVGKLESFGTARISDALVNGQTFYRVRLGPIQSVEAADKLLNNVLGRGVVQDARIIVDK